MNTWYVHAGDEQYGPCADTDLMTWADAGYLNRTDFVWRQGMHAWVRADQVPGLFPAVTSLPGPTYRPLADVLQATSMAGPPGGHPAPSRAGTHRERASTSPPGEGRFRRRLLLFMLLTVLGLILVAWVFGTSSKEEALVLWTWIAVLLMGLFSFGLPVLVLFSGRRRYA